MLQPVEASSLGKKGKGKRSSSVCVAARRCTILHIPSILCISSPAISRQLAVCQNTICEGTWVVLTSSKTLSLSFTRWFWLRVRQHTSTVCIRLTNSRWNWMRGVFEPARLEVYTCVIIHRWKIHMHRVNPDTLTPCKGIPCTPSNTPTVRTSTTVTHLCPNYLGECVGSVASQPLQSGVTARRSLVQIYCFCLFFLFQARKSNQTTH